MKQDEVIQRIRDLKDKTKAQAALLELVDKPGKDDSDEKKLKAMIRVEATAFKAIDAKKALSKLLSKERSEEGAKIRRNRSRELYNSAGLLILAGLVDTKSGKPVFDRGELLGGLLSLASASAADRAGWKKAGDSLIAEKEKSK